MIAKRTNRTMEQRACEIQSLPLGLTLSRAAKKLRLNYTYASRELKSHGYQIKDTRGGFKGRRKLTPAKIKRINWKLSDAALGRKYKVSRERIRQVRQAQGKPKVNGRKA